MGRGRPRKDAARKFETSGAVTSEGQKRALRPAARAAINKVMEIHNSLHTAKQSLHDKVSQVIASNSIHIETENENDDLKSVSEDDKMHSKISSEVKSEDDSSAPIVKSPSKSWTASIWGDSTEEKKETDSADITNDLKTESKSNIEEESVVIRFSSRVAAKSLSQSSGSTPSTTTSTPRSGTPESLPQAGKVAVSKSKKKEGKSKTRIKRRIRTLSDSEDSSVSTDSPLKPKTYTDNEGEAQKTSPVIKRSTRIPKKNKEPELVAKSEPMEVEENSSPVEEPPLIPKGFLEQQKKEQELRHRLGEAPLVNNEEDEEQRRIREADDQQEVERRIKSFKQLKENYYLCKKYVNKETRKLQCECVLSRDEVESGAVGCGEDCLNRLIYIECGKYCLLENNCSNKRFQNNLYADVEVFKTDWKGVGLRARSNIRRDTFIMEYVGEVLDTRLFKKRAKNYSKDGVKHFYFMALSKDQFVDATLKGNISRFINHSCEPNAETQKWTVNGEIRVGFFTTKDILAGEEICFDYKFERYGNVAQECFCGADNCKRWIGGEPTSDSGIEEVEEWSEDEEEEEELPETAKKEVKKKEKKKREKKPKKYEVDDYEEELQRLVSSGVRNKMHTVQLCRLMVRATKAAKPKLTELLIEADQPCLRLFLDYQGLKILYSWMFMLGWSSEELELKLKIENVLSVINFPHKTMLMETKVYDTVERWSKDSPSEAKDEGVESTPVSRAATPTPAESRVTTPEDGTAARDPPAEEPGQMCVGAVLKAQAEVGEEKQDSLELDSEKMEDGVAPVSREELPLTEAEEKMVEDVSGEAKQAVASPEQMMIMEIQARALELLTAWAGLQEMFRIPKKERQAERREHEREADRREEAGTRRLSSGYRSYQESHASHGVLRGGYTAPAPAVTGNRRNLRLDDRTGRLSRSNLHRDDRRMLFQAKVEEEARQKVLRNAVSARHEQCCKLLSLDPTSTPLLPKYPEFYLSAGKWIPMPPPPHSIDPAWTTPMMAALPPEAFRPGDPQLPNPRSIYPPGCCPEPPAETIPQALNTSETEAEICAYYDKLYYSSRASSPLSAAISAQLERRRHVSGGSVDISPDYRSPSPVNRSASPPKSLPFLSSSASEEPLLQTHREEESCDHQEPSLTHEAKSESSHVESASVDLGPSQPRTTAAGDTGPGLLVRLPPRWRAARDPSGRVYFYHAHTKQAQWEPPTEDHEERFDSEVPPTQETYRIETAETDSEEDQGEEGEDTDTEEDSEEETEDSGAPEPEPEVGEIPDSDLSASEKRMLLRMRRRTKEERRNMRRLKREKFKERHEQERLVTRERHKRHRRDGLVEEHLVPARVSDKDKLDLMTFKEMRERLLNKDKIREEQLKEEREEEERERREERARLEKTKREERKAMEKAKRETDLRQVGGEEQMDISLDISMSEVPLQSSVTSTSSSHTSARTTQAAADTSTDVEKKHKEKFLKEMSKLVVKILDPYRKKGVKGHISKTDDFKHLAKKLTFTILYKELKVCKNIEELKANEKVKKKASDYVSKYMKKYDREYRRSPNQED